MLESHIKCGGSAHTFSRFHKGEKYSFEVGPSIFEGLDRPSLNPLRMIFDILDEQMPVKTYTGLGYWTPSGYWRFPIGSQQKFEDLLMAQAEDGPKAVEVRRRKNAVTRLVEFFSYRCLFPFLFHIAVDNLTIGMERTSQTSKNLRWFNNCCFIIEFKARCRFPGNDRWQFTIRHDSPRCVLGPVFDI